MNLFVRLLRAFALSLLLLFAFALIAIGIGGERLGRFDEQVARVVQAPESPALTKAMEAVSFIGTTKPVVALALIAMAILFFALRHRLELILFVVVLGGSTVLNSLLKAQFHRERPELHRLVNEAGFSFPSGHAMAAVSLYGITAYLLWHHARGRAARVTLLAAAILITAAIGYSRIYLGVHYPSDVIGGYLLSGFWLTASVAVFRGAVRRRAVSAGAAASAAAQGHGQ